MWQARPEWRESLGARIPVYIGCAVVGDTMGALWLTPSEIIKQVLKAQRHLLLATPSACFCPTVPASAAPVSARMRSCGWRARGRRAGQEAEEALALLLRSCRRRGFGWLADLCGGEQRLQSGASASATQAVQSIYQKSGLNGFYSGLSGLLARDIPYRAMQLPLYEVARDAYTNMYCLGREMQPAEAMIVGAAVGMLAAGLTTPLDVVKSRMMVGTSAGTAIAGRASALPRRTHPAPASTLAPQQHTHNPGPARAHTTHTHPRIRDACLQRLLVPSSGRLLVHASAARARAITAKACGRASGGGGGGGDGGEGRGKKRRRSAHARARVGLSAQSCSARHGTCSCSKRYLYL